MEGVTWYLDRRMVTMKTVHVTLLLTGKGGGGVEGRGRVTGMGWGGPFF